VVLDVQLSCNANITSVARSCRIALYNIHRTRPFLTREAAQILAQVLIITRLDYCNSLLAGLPASAIKPLQHIQNTAARLVFNLPKLSHEEDSKYCCSVFRIVLAWVEPGRCGWLPVGGVGCIDASGGELQHVLGGPHAGVRVGLEVQQLGGQAVVRGVGRGGDVHLQLG